MKWLCVNCKAINTGLAYQCHNCNRPYSLQNSSGAYQPTEDQMNQTQANNDENEIGKLKFEIDLERSSLKYFEYIEEAEAHMDAHIDREEFYAAGACWAMAYYKQVLSEERAMLEYLISLAKIQTWEAAANLYSSEKNRFRDMLLYEALEEKRKLKAKSSVGDEGETNG